MEEYQFVTHAMLLQEAQHIHQRLQSIETRLIALWKWFVDEEQRNVVPMALETYADNPCDVYPVLPMQQPVYCGMSATTTPTTMLHTTRHPSFVTVK